MNQPDQQPLEPLPTDPDYTPIFVDPDPLEVSAGDTLVFEVTTLACVDLYSVVSVKRIDWDALMNVVADVPWTSVTICIPGGAASVGTAQLTTSLMDTGKTLLLIARGMGTQGPRFAWKTVRIV